MSTRGETVRSDWLLSQAIYATIGPRIWIGSGEAAMPIVSTIVPIFLVVILGWGVQQRKNFIPQTFLIPANRLVYYVAIPAMIFQSTAKATLHDFDLLMVAMTLAAAAIGYGGAWLFCRLKRIENARAASFIQSAGHGNLGYIGLAVAFYYLGEAGLVHASLVAGFLMILQNVLSVIALQAFGPRQNPSGAGRGFWIRILGNPVILSVLAGLAVSITGLPVPLIIEQTLKIVSGMALPTALLIIGASLSLDRIRERAQLVVGAALFKLLVLPGLGYLFYRLCGIASDGFLPGLILLASPTATISYVMAREMGGDGDLAVATISASTLASAVTFILWLKLAAL
jgi:malate permease and related proteins